MGRGYQYAEYNSANMAVPCTDCGAKPLQRCSTDLGATVHHPHKARVKAAREAQGEETK